jgi:hypothetical protein
MVVVMTTNLLMKAEAVLLVAMQKMQVAEAVVAAKMQVAEAEALAAVVVMAKMQVEVQK